VRPVGITVHVERLVLDGVPVGAHDAELVGAAVQAGLGRMLGAGATEPHAPPGEADAPSVTVPARADPERLGDAIARAIHQRIRDASVVRHPAGDGTVP
jgi:hypothetical protein